MSINRSKYTIPKMDCPVEEQMIRMALSQIEGIRSLDFDLNTRSLVVWHSIDVGRVTDKLVGLKLGTELSESQSVSESEYLSQDSLQSDRHESQVLWTLLGINATMFVVEFVSGWVVESTGLIADSLDMLADATVYGISLYAVGKAPLHKLTAARASGWFQMLLALGALTEVVRRFIFGSEPEPFYMVGVAAVALVANVACLWLLAKHRNKGAHMKASWIFSTNDVIANVGVIVAGILVSLTGTRYPDLVIGCIIAAVVFYGALRILKLK
ncbi:cation transporter [bacterium]|nr:cation transporter [bacterium]